MPTIGKFSALCANAEMITHSQPKPPLGDTAGSDRWKRAMSDELEKVPGEGAEGS
jgi:hypothetical protein